MQGSVRQYLLGIKLLSFDVDCTGYSQAGLKWIKKLHAKSAGEAATAAWDDLVPAYDIHSRWKTFIFSVPPELRDRLPVPGGYDNVPWLYTFIPSPGKERKNFVVDKIEGHRSKFFIYCIVFLSNISRH